MKAKLFWKTNGTTLQGCTTNKWKKKTWLVPTLRFSKPMIVSMTLNYTSYQILILPNISELCTQNSENCSLKAFWKTSTTTWKAHTENSDKCWTAPTRRTESPNSIHFVLILIKNKMNAYPTKKYQSIIFVNLIHEIRLYFNNFAWFYCFWMRFTSPETFTNHPNFVLVSKQTNVLVSKRKKIASYLKAFLHVDAWVASMLFAQSLLIILGDSIKFKSSFSNELKAWKKVNGLVANKTGALKTAQVKMHANSKSVALLIQVNSVNASCLV